MSASQATLKGEERDKGGGNEEKQQGDSASGGARGCRPYITPPTAAAPKDTSGESDAPKDNRREGELSQAKFRIARVSRVDKNRSLIILRGFARQGPENKFRSVEVRVMLDSGAEDSFISPSMVTRLGAAVTRGHYGDAITAFGGKSQLRERVEGLYINFPGTRPGGLLSHVFQARSNFLVAPADLGDKYDIILGTPFMRQHRGHLVFDEPCVVQLTDAGGAVTEMKLIEKGRGDTKAAGIATEAETRAAEKEDKERAIDKEVARLALEKCPHLVMSLTEFTERVLNDATRSLRITPILYRMRDDEAERTRLASVKANAKAAEGADDTSLLPPEERAKAEAMKTRLMTEFADIAPKELPKGVPGARDGHKVEIKIKEGTQPIGRYGPRMSHADTVEADKMIRELLDKGFIRPSRSPWGSPMFLVEKPDGTKRMVIDYRALNSATVRNRYPLPRVDELFDRLQGARYFSTIDLKTGYWQIAMAENSISLTAFTSRHGHFEWTVLPMGLTNAPAEFMRLMEDTFRGELNIFVLAFLDDIMVFSKTLEEHEKHLRVVLQRLRDRRLFIKLSKCAFFRQEVEFLGHRVGRQGTRMMQDKLDAILKWPEPKSKKEVEQFLGLAGYYRRFIAHFSKIASPLSELCGTLKKTRGIAKSTLPIKPFVWEDRQKEAFATLKKAVSEAPCLALPDPELDFIVHTDASGYGTGAVLMQEFKEGMRPIAFLSHKMTKAERNYPVHEQELLAILKALRAWRHYLSGRKFKILTDHQSLQYVESSAMATPRQMRWAAWFAEFDFTICYVPGKVNVVADALSRSATGGAPDADTDSSNDEYATPTLISAIAAMAPLPIRVRTAAATDSQYEALLAMSDAELLRRNRAKADGLLYRQEPNTPDTGQLVVPNNAELRRWLLSWAHDASESAHRGGHRMYKWLGERVWWPKMQQDANAYATSCEECQRNKPDLQGRQGLPLAIETPQKFGLVWCLDFIGPLKRTPRGHNAVMVCIEKVSRLTVYVPLRTDASAPEVFHAFNTHVIAHYGTPQTLISDRDTRFTSRFWEDIWSGMHTTLKRSTAFHPQTDGSTERANRTLIEALRAYVNSERDDWDVFLPQLQRATNSSVCASTGHTPDMMASGHQVRSELDAALEADGVAPRINHPGARELAERRERALDKARELIKKAQEKQQRDSMRGRRPADIKAGDKVWLSNKNMRKEGEGAKLGAVYSGPYEVVTMRGSNAAQLKLPDVCRLHPVFNLDLLKKFVDGENAFPGRPRRFDLQGPVPQEDPDAGGPGDPVWEVERVIGERKVRGVQQYKVHWVGWPSEQDSWLTADECDGCADLVVEFEERREAAMRARLVRSNALGLSKQVRMQTRTVELWAARVKRVKQAATPPTAAERQQQEESRAQTNKNHPRIPQVRARMNAKGSIDMGTRRCAGDTMEGGICKLKTRHGCLCWVHRKKGLGLAVKPSRIDGAGLGLFATREFKKGARIIAYTGDYIPTVDGEDGNDFDGSIYVLALSDAWALDAARTNTAEGRMLNDARGTPYTNNAEFHVNHRDKTAWLSAKKRIKEGDELLVSYGNSFWNGTRKKAVLVVDGAAASRPQVKDIRVPAAAPALASSSSSAPARPAPRGNRGKKSATGRREDPICIDGVHLPAISIRFNAITREGDDDDDRDADAEGVTWWMGVDSVQDAMRCIVASTYQEEGNQKRSRYWHTSGEEYRYKEGV